MKNHPAKRNILLPLVAAVALVGGLLLGHLLPRPGYGRAAGTTTRTALSKDKLNTILELVYENYVDAPLLDSVEEEIIPTLLESLDPHSVYIPARDMESRSRGSSTGWASPSTCSPTPCG